jgi:hypothetical protein
VVTVRFPPKADIPAEQRRLPIAVIPGLLRRT